MNLNIRIADYHQQKDANAIVGLLDHYAQDPMGGGQSLPKKVTQNLIPTLQKIENAFSVLCFAGERPVGLVNCFQGFSTFNCQPLINIHDVIVRSNFRGQGISLKMLKYVEYEAKERGCCKLTLEVLERNDIAKSAYKGFGFDAYQLIPRMGQALFWQKVL